LAVALAGCTSTSSNDMSARNGDRGDRAGYYDNNPDRSAMNDNNTDRMSNRQRGTLSSADEQFIKDAAAGGMYEVEAGQIASNKGTSNHVKMVAQHMVTDHSKANDQLMDIAKRKGVAMPPTMTAQQNDMISKLNNLQGTDFDKEYLKQQKKAHEETIAKFQKEAKSGSDADVKQFASQTLPTLQEHLRMITKGGNGARLGSER
jgi:putative membrane protein